MKKCLVVFLFLSFLFTSCSSGAPERNYIMGDAVEHKDSRAPIVPQT